MTGSHSPSASNKFCRYKGSAQVTPAEIMELSGLMEEERGKDRKEEEWDAAQEERGRGSE